MALLAPGIQIRYPQIPGKFSSVTSFELQLDKTTVLIRSGDIFCETNAIPRTTMDNEASNRWILAKFGFGTNLCQGGRVKFACWHP